MLKRIAISNFRSCDNTTVQLGSPLVALVGKNGVGKTNLLHAILYASGICSGKSSAQTLTPQDSSKPVTLELEFSIGGSDFRYSSSIEPRGSEKIFVESLIRLGDPSTTLLSRTGETMVSAWHPAPLGIGPDISAISAVLQLSPKESEPHATLQPVVQSLGSVRYYRATDSVKDHENISPFVARSVYSEWAKNPRQSSSELIALRLIHMHQEEQDKFSELKELLGPNGLDLLSDIFVGTVPLPREMSIGTKDLGSKSDAFILGFSPGSALGGSGNLFPYSGLSAGTRRVLQILTYLIFDESTTMLLEQPEDSIHAGLLHKLIEILQGYAQRAQLVFTTHSNRVLNLMSPSDVRLVCAENGKTVVRGLDESEVETATAYVMDSGTLSEYLDTL